MLILGSTSPRRKELLALAGIQVNRIIDPNIDEKPFKSELPIKYVERMSRTKALAIVKNKEDYVLTADTIVTRGRRVLGKPENISMAETYLRLLSGSRHRVITSVCLSYNNDQKVRNVITTVKLKRLSDAELSSYLDSGEWKGKAGGYAIQGRASSFIPFISGSYTNVVGLPLAETINLLIGSGFFMDKVDVKND